MGITAGDEGQLSASAGSPATGNCSAVGRHGPQQAPGNTPRPPSFLGSYFVVTLCRRREIHGQRALYLLDAVFAHTPRERREKLRQGREQKLEFLH